MVAVKVVALASALGTGFVRKPPFWVSAVLALFGLVGGVVAYVAMTAN